MFVNVLRKMPMIAIALGVGIGAAGIDRAEASVLDIYYSGNHSSVWKESSTIQSNKSAANFYNYSSFSGHPDDVRTTKYGANVWVQENTQTGAYSFGFIVGRDNTTVKNRLRMRFNIRNSTSNTYIAIADERREVRKVGQDSYVAAFKTRNNADGFIVEGITGSDWVIEFEILSDGATRSFHSAGDAGKVGLWRQGVYEITLDGNLPYDASSSTVAGSDIMEEKEDGEGEGDDKNGVNIVQNDEPVEQGPQDETAEVSEPTGLAIMGLGLLALGAGLRRKHA